MHAGAVFPWGATRSMNFHGRMNLDERITTGSPSVLAL
jgi:hypothetical protein